MHKTLSIRKLILTHFRSYPCLELELEALPVIITGANGIGKTNILEAVSFLSPGRGLRNARLTDIDHRGQSNPWAVASVLEAMYGECTVGTGRSPSPANERSAKRIVKIDGNIMRGQAELASLFSVIWLTPQMDPLFLQGSSERRRFLDRLVYHFDPEHARRVAVYEYAMRERAKLLQQGRKDNQWLATLESKMAEAAVAIAVARREASDILQQAILQATTPFPKALIQVEGTVEQWVGGMTALQIEETLQKKLAETRQLDALTGRTSIGTHRSDFVVTHAEKNMPAALCSTGEQKALLLSIILAEARARAQWRQSVPVLLLDEVVAHLDGHRREALFQEILSLRAQAWITGTDAFLFEGLGTKAQYIDVAAKTARYYIA